MILSAGPGSRPVTSLNSSRGMAPWWLEAYRAIGLATAHSTRKGYQHVVCHFEAFRVSCCCSAAWPILVEQLLHYGVSLKVWGLTVSSIRRHFSALASASKVMANKEFKDDFRVRKMLEGWEREASPQRDDRQPIFPTMLKGFKEAWPEVCSSVYEAVLFHAAGLLAFQVALYISEFVASSKGDQSQKALILNDISFKGEELGKQLLNMRKGYMWLYPYIVVYHAIIMLEQSFANGLSSKNNNTISNNVWMHSELQKLPTSYLQAFCHAVNQLLQEQGRLIQGR